MTNQTQIDIVNSSSPLAAGFPTGLLTVTTSPQTISQGTPVGAHIVATSAADPTQAVIYYYEKGETGYLTNGFTMPARRVFFFLQDDTAAALNAAGTNLLNAAVDFALALQSVANTNAPTVPVLWTVGQKDNGWPQSTGGGANASFVQETGSINPLPGSPDSTSTAGGADNDYYFTGSYTTVIGSVTNVYGDYTPVGDVAADEEAAERAFAGADDDWRVHFNLPTTLKTNDVLSITFAAFNLDEPHPDARYGVIGFINGVLIQPEIVIRHADLQVDYTTPAVTLASVNAKTGPGFDNIISLKGVNYSADGGGAWMGFDYVQLNGGAAPVTEPGAKFTGISKQGANIVIQWAPATAALQSATLITGTWTDVAGASGGTYTAPLTDAPRYYRFKP
jgi:hypothetical protein